MFMRISAMMDANGEWFESLDCCVARMLPREVELVM